MDTFDTLMAMLPGLVIRGGGIVVSFVPWLYAKSQHHRQGGACMVEKEGPHVTPHIP